MKAFALLLLALLALPAFAVQAPVVVSSAAYASYIQGASENAPPLSPVFDADETTHIIGSKPGASIILDFSTFVTVDKPMVYISDITVANTGGGSYSLATSEDGTTWTDVPGAQTVQQAGSVSFPVGVRAKFVKYFFISSNGTDLGELTVRGWRTSVPHIVSKYSLVKQVGVIDGSANFGGGTGNPAAVFNGTFTDYQMLPRAGSGSYFDIDFSSETASGYYITEIRVGSTGDKRYTLQHSMNGSNWTDVNGAVSVKPAGTAVFEVGVTATHVRYLFVDGSNWDFSTQYLAEIQVWGMDADDLPCTHPNIETAVWIPVPNSATCTKQGIDERFCPDCGERFTKTSNDPPLGHDYISTLARPGGFKRFGIGSITCSRCDYRIDFTNTPETDSTNGPIDLVTVGGMAVENLVQFTDLSVTSTDHTEWGPNPAKIIDGSWTEWWVSYWVSAGNNNQYVDFVFGTEIDLTKIDLSVKDVNQTFQFFDVDDATGSETQLKQFGIIRTDLDGYQNHVYRPEGVDPPKDYGDSRKDYWDELVVEDDPGVPANQTDENGNLVLNSKGETIVNCWQRFTVRFFNQPCKHLRIRCPQTSYSLWSGNSMCLIECHPWGIVRGGSETRYRKETLLILQ